MPSCASFTQNVETNGTTTQITHSEWASEDAYSASAGSGLAKSKTADTSFKRLPFNFCAVSLQPFVNPVCTSDGTIFDIDNITAWLETHNTNPVTGKALKVKDLIKLNFAKNDEGDMGDPVTYKVFTNNTHIVALGNTGNVFSYDSVERLNIKAKMWRDLVSDEEFGRKDIITLQDPQNLESRNLSSFNYVKQGISTLTPAQARERNATVNKSALGNAASVLKSEETHTGPKVGKYLHQKQSSNATATSPPNSTTSLAKPSANASVASKPLPASHSAKPPPKQSSHHTTGATAASFTSTGLTPSTSSALATLTDEEYMLVPRRVKSPGYARITIPPHGDLVLELLPEHAPRAVWNFIQLAKRGYYNDVGFHRNIRGFMLQGGDPTGSGRGGKSCWGGTFKDEFEGPQSHDRRGVLSMANKGKNTNTSQFFITYRACKHLDRKHTVFGRVVEGLESTLSSIETVEVAEGDKRPKEPLVMKEVVVFVDPFEEFLKSRDEKERREMEEEEIRKKGGRDEDRITWTGKRIRGKEDAVEVPTVGRYLNGDGGGGNTGSEMLEEWEISEPEPVKKKIKPGGFGNFDSW